MIYDEDQIEYNVLEVLKNVFLLFKGLEPGCIGLDGLMFAFDVALIHIVIREYGCKISGCKMSGCKMPALSQMIRPSIS